MRSQGAHVVSAGGVFVFRRDYARISMKPGRINPLNFSLDPGIFDLSFHFKINLTPTLLC